VVRETRSFVIRLQVKDGDKMLKIFSTFGGEPAVKLGAAIGAADAARAARAWPEAALLYRKALDIDGSLAPIWVQYGHALKEAKNFKEAEAAYRQSLSIDDQVADTHLQLGHLHKILGRAREAEQDYVRALERDPGSSDARAELRRMGWNASRLRALMGKTDASSAATKMQRVRVALELSDLVDFLQGARYPTGIQRVQLALAQAFAESSDEDQVQFVYFDHLQCAWRGIERRQLWDIIDLVHNDERCNETRLSIAARIKSDLLGGEDFVFATGCALVNPGTSWGYLNYFLAVRNAKRQYAIVYVPLVHDCIPLIYQEFCNPVLVHDFINWMSGILTHADLILTNSENTKADFRKAAAELGLPPTQCATVHLNGQFGAAPGDNEYQDRAALDVLRDHNLDIEDFVLFVSTIEPRKNHAIALSAWSRMLKSKLDRNVPRLVCVGNTGWMNDDFHQRLARDKILRERVVVLNNVPEYVLKLLYKRCLFTLFPSLYEGWGLPISEAFAHGKVPLVSNVSSHPEAGGDLAVYFDLNSEADFQSKLEMLIYEVDKRRSLEQKIAASTPLRPWSEIGKEIFGTVENLKAALPETQPGGADSFNIPAPLACGRYYSFARNSASRLRDVVHSGDIFRDGLNWHGPEYWGCWVNGRSADLVFSLADSPGEEFLIYLHWRGPENIDTETVISLPASTWSKPVKVRCRQDRWDAIPITFGPRSKREVRIRISSACVEDFGKTTGGRDARQVSVGVKGLYVAVTSDTLQRLAISEAIVRRELKHLARRFPQVAVL
jgi:glycosyltransferase involved in cell wall biosynthesis